MPKEVQLIAIISRERKRDLRRQKPLSNAPVNDGRNWFEDHFKVFGSQITLFLLWKEQGSCQSNVWRAQITSQSKRYRYSMAEPVSTVEVAITWLVLHCSTTTFGASASTTLRSYALVLETVPPPIPCNRMIRSSSYLSFLAVWLLKLRRRKIVGTSDRELKHAVRSSPTRQSRTFAIRSSLAFLPCLRAVLKLRNEN